MQPPRLSVWERRDRPPLPDSDMEENEMEIDRGHDYCSVPEPAALDLSLCENEELKSEIEDLRKQLEQAKVNSRFGLQRFVGSDEDIRFYTRFATHKHMMAFWEQIEPSTHRMIRVTSSKVTRETGLYVKTRALPAID
ncbi:hypothetical protein DPX16_10930 [Anabarilius grahami]|uniref:Uncharacterized protein n=1 Tax=Anabarilius grahami TaxID=495550 RepID=A0A3N0XUE9_ANAGA|nr:hypothetical protein DPX16_10930 [Anabarilius grahami]